MTHEQGPGSAPARKANRLINEQSPYLRQHAYNPVDWYPWGEQALARAKAENKPILLSIGYSACHWCHVMERESFEDEAIANLMNEYFVPIKVDREERPDLDQIYMDAVQLIAGRGGWPLTVFLTPEGKPFFGGTYFPPEDRHGSPGFARVLKAVAEAYRNNAHEVSHNVERLTAALAAMSNYAPPEGELRRGLPLAAARALGRNYDSVHGGLGGAPKFPNTFVFSLLLRMSDAEGDVGFAEMVRHTLTSMAKGGIYDQIGSGFHRYSVDERWLVPHFEKMLYDNAQLARLYLDAGRALNEPEFIRVAGEILDYVLREMTSPEGGFYSTQDADSEGEEGKFFLWTPAQVEDVVGAELAKIARRFFDITEEGNFESGSILHRTLGVGDAARLFRMSEEEMAAAVAEIRRKLFEARERRVKPARDEKILAAWNGMMIGAFAEGYRAIGERRYLDAAKRAADFVLAGMWDGGALKRSFKDGVARFNAYLEDYGLMITALIDTYEASLESAWLARARTLAEAMLEHFLDREKGGFFFTSDQHEALIARSKPVFDGSTPSGNSAAVMALLRLHAYTGEPRYQSEAERALRLFKNLIEQQPFSFSHMLEAIDLYERGAIEIAIIGPKGTPEFTRWVERLGLLYLPNRALFWADPQSRDAAFLPEQVRGRPQVDGKLTAYVCRERSCSSPMVSIEQVEAELRG
jgi:uncharacterized protein